MDKNLIYRNGKCYYGQMIDNIPNGRGTLILPSGTKYIGEFINGKRDGNGKCIYIPCRNRNNKKVSSIYCGQWKNDKKHGNGRLDTYDNYGRIKCTVLGYWENGKK